MTNKSQGRSLTEVIIAVVFVGFLTGFVVVLCIGNYYRAKRAMERQRHVRLAKLTGRTPGMMMDSPRSQTSSSEYSSDERASLLLKRTPQQGGIGKRSLQQQQQQQHPDDLLLQVEDSHISRV